MTHGNSRRAGFERHPLIDNRGLWLVEAREAGATLQGFAIVVGHPGFPRGCLLDEIGVRTDQERRGVGRSLIEAAVDWMTSNGFEMMTAYVLDGREGFFSRVGFDPWPRERSRWFLRLQPA